MSEEFADTGVIVGRFQVDDLHEGHKKLIDSVCESHLRVIIFLGLSPCKCSTNNPLDFESRKKMINRHYPDINVLYMKDVYSDEVWSRNLDEQIGNMIGPSHTARLYGSRDSFIKHYKGKFSTEELKQEVFVSGSGIRKKLAIQSKGTIDFNSGVIWATLNQYPACLTTVDIAIFNDNYSEILLARKEYEKQYRLIGGFVNPGESFEDAAKRETLEESHLGIRDVEYVGSYWINDWRYNREQNKITTALFQTRHYDGVPEPDDDIVEVRWFKFDDDLADEVVEPHKILIGVLLQAQIERIERLAKSLRVPVVNNMSINDK